MYTQCPHCRTAFQVTPADLKRAHGTVRCGQCGELFDAIEKLSPEPPVQGQEAPAAPDNGEPPSLEPRDDAREPASGAAAAERGRESIEAPATIAEAEPKPETPPAILAEPVPEPTTGAGPPASPSAESVAAPSPPAAVEPADGAPAGEPDIADEPLRFDDDTPLEEILASLGEDIAEPAAAEPPPASPPPSVEAEATGEPDVEPAAEIDDRDDWLSLLAELDLDEPSRPGESADVTPAQAPAAGSASEPGIAVVESERGAGEEIVLGADDEILLGGDDGAAAEITPVAGEWILVDESDADESDESAPAPETRAEGPAEQDDALAISGVLFDELVQSGEFEGLLDPSAVPAQAAEPGADGGDARSSTDVDAAAKTAAAVVAELDEIGEPDSAAERLAAEAALDEEEIIDATLIERRAARPRVLLWSAAAVLLILALAVQVIHGQRATLATLPEFGTRLQSLYGALGLELEPYWDIGALCVESSAGDASADTLQITSVIVHRGDRPQPYPVLQVSLTDRWQSVIGSRTVPATDYLPAGELRDVRIRPGDRVRARARLADPGSEAAGYELHVCYPEGEKGLRCSGACL